MTNTSSAPRTTATTAPHRRALLVGAALAVATLTVAGCSGSDDTSAPSDAPTSAAASAPAPGEQDGDTARGRDDGTAVSGLLAAITGDVAQVQSTSAQTAVSWTEATTVSSSNGTRVRRSTTSTDQPSSCAAAAVSMATSRLGP